MPRGEGGLDANHTFAYWQPRDILASSNTIAAILGECGIGEGEDLARQIPYKWDSTFDL